MTDLTQLGLSELTALIRAGQVTPSKVMSAHLDRIAKSHNHGDLFQFLDPDRALRRARLLDVQPSDGALHGVPFVVMDTIDTRGMPTSWGTSLYANRVPERNAPCVERLITAGAVAMAKTAVPPFALNTGGGPTAEVVNAFMASFALCSGSDLVPDVATFKPTRSGSELRGVMTLSPTLDRICILARTLSDLRPVLSDLRGEPIGHPIVAPKVGILLDPSADATLAQIDTTACRRIDLTYPEAFRGLAKAHDTIRTYEAARSRAAEAALGPRRVGQQLCDLVTAGTAISDKTYTEAMDHHQTAQAELDQLLADVDGLLLSAACPAFNEMSNPCVTLPQRGPHHFQLIGRQGQDTQLLDIACRIFGQAQHPD